MANDDPAKLLQLAEDFDREAAEIEAADVLVSHARLAAAILELNPCGIDYGVSSGGGSWALGSRKTDAD